MLWLHTPQLVEGNSEMIRGTLTLVGPANWKPGELHQGL
jgi:hypothetical protein